MLTRRPLNGEIATAAAGSQDLIKEYLHERKGVKRCGANCQCAKGSIDEVVHP
jgi:hypothetical protein